MSIKDSISNLSLSPESSAINSPHSNYRNPCGHPEKRDREYYGALRRCWKRQFSRASRCLRAVVKKQDTPRANRQTVVFCSSTTMYGLRHGNPMNFRRRWTRTRAKGLRTFMYIATTKERENIFDRQPHFKLRQSLIMQ